MKTNRGDMPASPFEGGENNSEQPYTGMTIREQFDMAALTGIISDGLPSPDRAALVATEYADALLAELENTK